ncbi:MAG: oxygenase MpaB family protein [Nocardioides sp.]
MRRDHWRTVNDAMDPETQFTDIYRNVVMYEFPWDMNQALSFALFRTYAVPGIGRLLDRTGEFTGSVQKRYDDTAILLEQPFRLGFDHPQGRAAIRRINQMHKAYDIPAHEFRYVLSTFVVVPKRWLDDYGKRPLTAGELRASVNYYRTLGRHMNIPDIPTTYDGFARLMDDYEAEHFAYDPGARRVADATLALMLTFHPRPAARAVEVFSRALMDPPLRDAFGYAAPPRAVERASRGLLKARGLALRAFPARTRAQTVMDLKWIRSYPDGYDVDRMGTFPSGASGCPVPHASAERGSSKPTAAP